jgi:protein-L-isoaspartate(D-aspartate) O-methyltransferase
MANVSKYSYLSNKTLLIILNLIIVISLKEKDSYKFQGMRKKMIEALRKKNITSEKILEAMSKIPRHLFLESNSALSEHLYEDKAFQIGVGQTISHPSTVAIQSHLLDIKAGEKILEIGTGSGYQTAVLLELGAKVYTIERQYALYEKTRVFLPLLGYTPRFFYGDGFKGLPNFGPFDKIIVTAGAPFIPETLIEQLVIGGIMVIPIGEGKTQKMQVGVKISEKNCEWQEMGNFAFVPMLENKV